MTKLSQMIREKEARVKKILKEKIGKGDMHGSAKDIRNTKKALKRLQRKRRNIVAIEKRIEALSQKKSGAAAESR